MPGNEPMLWPLILQVLLILTNAVFACAEIAVISMNDNRLSKLAASGDKRAIKLIKLTDQPAHFLATIQVGITLAGFLGSAFAADNFSGKLTQLFLDMGSNISVSTLDTISLILLTLILSYFTLVFGELVPKRIAMRKAEMLALAMSGFIFVVSKLFAPIVWILTASTNALLKLLGIDPHASDNVITEEEIRMLVDAGSEKGAIDPEEKEMIQNIFEFDDTTASEVMTHRTEVSVLWVDESDEQWAKTINESRHSIYPICSGSVDNITGVLYTKDYYRLRDKSRENVMTKAVKPAYFVPETVRTDVLFRNMKKHRKHFAVILDEYGGMSGIVTMNDLLEELVGDLEDDILVPEELPPIQRIDSNTWLIQGMAPLEDVSKLLGVMLPEDDYDTFSGLIFGMLGTIPDDGSTPEIEEYGLNIKVINIHEHRIESAIVSRSDKSSQNHIQ